MSNTFCIDQGVAAISPGDVLLSNCHFEDA